jgi:hypothetical protein
MIDMTATRNLPVSQVGTVHNKDEKTEGININRWIDLPVSLVGPIHFADAALASKERV